MRTFLITQTTDAIKKDFKSTLAFTDTEALISRAVQLTKLQIDLIEQSNENMRRSLGMVTRTSVIPAYIFHAAQVGIDRQIDHFGVMSHTSFRMAQHHLLTYMLLRANYNMLISNATSRLGFFFYSIIKHNEHLALHDQIMEYQAMGSTSDSEFESDFSSDDEYHGRKRPRMTADVLAKREAYLWEHDVAVNVETCGPGIKTRRKFYRKE